MILFCIRSFPGLAFSASYHFSGVLMYHTVIRRKGQKKELLADYLGCYHNASFYFNYLADLSNDTLRVMDNWFGAITQRK